jgi:inorganic pyrophosphatase
LRQGDEDGRQRNRGSAAKQAGKAFRPYGVAKRREYGNCDSACNESKQIFEQRFSTLLSYSRQNVCSGTSVRQTFFCTAPLITRDIGHAEFHKAAALYGRWRRAGRRRNARGSRAKFAYDPKLETFALTKSLLTGLTYPHDRGFVPSTKADDGNPLDIMVIHDAATFPGLVVTCRVIGILQIEQKSKGKSQRNDRLFAVPRRSHSEQALRDVQDLSRPIQDELEKFFVATDELEDKKLKIIGWKGPKVALKAIKAAAKSFAKEEQ